MKYLITTVLAAFVLLMTTNLVAQDYISNNFYEGYVVQNDGSRLEGFILYGTLEQNKSEVTFYTDKKNRKTKQKFKTKDVAGYKVGSEEYISVTYRSVLKQQVFAKVESKGHIMVLGVAEPSQEGGWAYTMALKKGDEDAIGTARFINFAKQMSEFVEDYEELAKKVADKESGYRLLSMMAIIEEYNTWYEAKN
jgi:hypothetical protein